MKKTILLILFALIFFASMGVGYFYLNTRNDQKNSSKVNENERLDNNIEGEMIAIETKEEIISPKAKIIETTYYKKCGHTDVKTIEVPEELVNMNEEEFKEKYKDWNINYFSPKEISVYKELDETCEEHYIIGADDGQINIYRINKEGEEELYETTNIYLEYLPEKDQEDLKNRIEVLGRKNLNEVLENFE